MASAKNARSNPKPKAESFGLLAIGSSGRWEVAIDESTPDADRWFAQIEGPSVSLYFEISSTGSVGEVLDYMNARQPAANGSPGRLGTSDGSLVISKHETLPVTLIRDDEYQDRFFLAVGAMESPIVRFVIAGTDAEEICGALREVKADLDADD